MNKTLDWRLSANSSLIICGPTSCGKTELVYEIIRRKDELFKENILETVYIYGVWQPGYDTIKKTIPNITFISVHDDYEQLLDPNKQQLCILDDVLVELSSNQDFSNSVTELFVHRNHHEQLFVCLLLQNLYIRNARTISLNCGGICLFKNYRDRSSINYLNSQVMPNKKQFLFESLEDATHNIPYGFLYIDFSHKHADDDLRIRNFLWPHGDMKIYIPKK